MSMCRDRVLEQLRDIIKDTTDNIIIVAHAGVNRLIISELLGISIKQSFLYQREYGSIIKLKYEGNILKVDNAEIQIE